MTTIASAPDLAAIKQRQQATWASGDYHMIGTQILIVSELLIEALDVHSTERVLDVATGSGNAALAAARRGCVGHRHRLRPGPARSRPPAGRGRGRRGRFPAGRCGGPAVRGRQLRCRQLRLRGDVRAGPGANRERARPRLPARRPHRARRPHARRLHRPAVQDHRRARPATGRPALPHPVGHRGSPRGAVRRGQCRDPLREAALRVPRHLARGVRGLLGRVLRADAEGVRCGRRRGPGGAQERHPRPDRALQPADDGTMVVPSEYLETVIVKHGRPD